MEKEEITIASAMKNLIAKNVNEVPMDLSIEKANCSIADYLAMAAFAKAVGKRGTVNDIATLQKMAGEQPDVKVEANLTLTDFLKGAEADVKDSD